MSIDNFTMDTVFKTTLQLPETSSSLLDRVLSTLRSGIELHYRTNHLLKHLANRRTAAVHTHRTKPPQGIKIRPRKVLSREPNVRCCLLSRSVPITDLLHNNFVCVQGSLQALRCLLDNLNGIIISISSSIHVHCSSWYRPISFPQITPGTQSAPNI